MTANRTLKEYVTSLRQCHVVLYCIQQLKLIILNSNQLYFL